MSLSATRAVIPSRCLALVLLLCSGCGGGGDGGSGASGQAASSISIPPGAIQVTLNQPPQLQSPLSGVKGCGLSLVYNGGSGFSDTCGALSWSTISTTLVWSVGAHGVTAGTPYSITVKTQPTAPRQDCVVTNGSGIVSATAVMIVPVTCTTLTARFVYVVNGSGNSISAYSIDPASGVLGVVNGSPFATAAGPSAITVDRDAGYAYVARQGTNSVVAYAIDITSGALSTVSGVSGSTGQRPTALMIDQASHFLFAANGNSGTVSILFVNPSTVPLALSTGPQVTAGSSPSAIATSTPWVRYGQGIAAYVYVANAGSNSVSGYQINGSFSALTPVAGTPVVTGIGPRALAVDKAGKFLYVANTGSGTVGVYGIDTPAGASTNATANGGALTPIAGSPFAVGGTPNAIALDPLGRFLFVVSDTTNTIATYAIASSTGALTSLTAITTTGISPAAVSVEPSGKFLYVVNSGSNDVSGYAINATSGALTPVAGSPYAAGDLPTAIAIAD